MATQGRDGAERLICLGVVVGARGVRGEVRIHSFTAAPADIAAYGPLCDETGERVFGLRIVGQAAKGHVIARVAGVDDRAAAEALKGLRLHVRRDALPAPEEEEYYCDDLVGLKARRVGGGDMGTVRGVHDFGAGAVIEIADSAGKGLMVPFTRQAVPEVDLAGGWLAIEPPVGLLEEPEAAAREATEDEDEDKDKDEA